MQEWVCTEVELNKYSYTFEGLRNIIMCSISRYDEFSAAADNLACLINYGVKCYSFMPHNSIYVIDSEGYVTEYSILEYESIK